MASESVAELPEQLQRAVDVSEKIERLMKDEEWSEVDRLARVRQQHLERFFSQWDLQSKQREVISTLTELKQNIERQTEVVARSKQVETAKVIDIRQAHKAAKAYQKNL